ncbi:hypothetical protein KGM_208507 [Danaus plexippus plexippus]|uniref:Uncharacterized protein n=1 Tax=Danaus plexippus plexippus TaxID=278856 RepID=A0A212EI75_DANPL|nr:hypothetical protein KGM_208507 [Danaus plexippus plexippus]
MGEGLYTQTASCIYLSGGTVAPESSWVAHMGAHLNVRGRAHGGQLFLGHQPPVQGPVPPLAASGLWYTAADHAHYRIKKTSAVTCVQSVQASYVTIADLSRRGERQADGNLW